MSRPAAARSLDAGLSVKRVRRVAWVRLERPRDGNRISVDLAQRLCDAAAAIELDDDVAIAVLTAAGKDFCLGVEDGGEWERRIDWVDAWGRLRCPVIAGIQGDALAEGLELVLACDLRIVSDRAHFAMPQLADGRMPGHGGTQRLPRVIGRTRALDLLLTGRRVDAKEAETMGLASRLVAHRDLEPSLHAVVAELEGKGPIALRYAKEAILKGSDLTLDQGARLEEDLYALLQTTGDRREGVRAFLEKRRPRFRGS